VLDQNTMQGQVKHQCPCIGLQGGKHIPMAYQSNVGCIVQLATFSALQR
jgi:hypothetical protein